MNRIYQKPSDLLSTLILTFKMVLDEKKDKEGKIKIFHPRTPINKSVENYVQRMFKFMGCSHSCYIIALILINRAEQRNKELIFTYGNFHKLFFVAVTVAAKFNDDHYYSIKYFAQVGGMTPKQLNFLQNVFLKIIDFNVFINPHEFFQATENLESFYELYIKSKSPKTLPQQPTF